MSIKKMQRHKKHRACRRWALEHQEEIMAKFENKCADCGRTNDLTIHHTKYENGFDNVKVLCNKCHRIFHIKELKKKLLMFVLDDLNKTNIETLEEYKEDLTKRIDAIDVDVMFDLKEIDGLPF